MHFELENNIQLYIILKQTSDFKILVNYIVQSNFLFCFPDSNSYKPTYAFPEEKEAPKPKGTSIYKHSEICCGRLYTARIPHLYKRIPVVMK